MLGHRSQDTITTVGNNIAEGKYVADLSFETGDNEDPKQLTYSKAIMNAYRFWLLSGSWDYVRQPSFSGFFDRWCNEYAMTDTGAQVLVEALRAKTQEAFGDSIELNECTAKADVNARRWYVSVEPIDIASGLVGKSDNPEIPAVVVDVDNNKLITDRENVKTTTVKNAGSVNSAYISSYKSEYSF